MTVPRLTEFWMRVENIQQETEFWEQGVGLERIRPKPGEPIDRTVIFDLGGPRLELHTGGTPAALPVGRDAILRTPVLLVEDSRAALEQALAHGATKVIELTAIGPTSSVVYVASPEGHVVGLLQGDELGYRARLGMQPLNSYW